MSDRVSIFEIGEEFFWVLKELEYGVKKFVAVFSTTAIAVRVAKEVSVKNG